MRTDPTANPRATAIEQLEQFGLSNYAAQTFVTLRALGSATAREVSNASEVPRTRVYDAVDELHNAGLVDIKQGSPKQFWAISAETTSQTFEHKLNQRIDSLQTALEEIEPIESRTEQSGVWTVNGHRPTTERVLEFFETAREEIVYMTVEELLTEELITALAAAADRGVSIQLGGVSPAVEAQIEAEIPDVRIFESLWNWSDSSAGRLMMVDSEKTLVSAFVTPKSQSGSSSETAIWGHGETNSLVTVLRAIFTWQLESESEP